MNPVLFLKILMFFVGIIITIFAYRVYYFSKEKKYALFGISFLIFSLIYLVQLYSFFTSITIFINKVPLYVFLMKLLFLTFLFLLISSLLVPRTILEWGLIVYVLIFTFLLSYYNDTMYIIALSLLLLLVSFYLLTNYISNLKIESLLTFIGMLLLTFSLFLQIYSYNIAVILEALSGFSFLIYILILFIARTNNSSNINRLKKE